CRGTVRASAGPGTTLAGIRVGKAVSAKAAASFVLDDKDVAIEAMLSFAGREPVVWTQSAPLAAGWSASVVTVAAPSLKTAMWQPRRALFVIDGSRSMELVGKPLVNKVLGTIAAALPAGIELDAIIYDRTAERVFKTWRKESPAAVAELQAAVTRHAPKNGSALKTAFEAAQAAITDGTRAQTLVIVISDGVLGEVSSTELVAALGVTASTADVLSVAVTPPQTTVSGAALLRAPVTMLGGTFVEVTPDDVDDALQVVDEWLRPSFLELDLGTLESVESLRSGGGFTRAIVHRTAAPALVLRGRGETAFKVTARPGPSAPGLAQLALAALPANPEPYFADADVGDASIVRATRLYKRIVAAHPYVREGLALAVLTTQGRIARNRIAMVKGGGPYERITAASDPVDWQTSSAPVIALGAAAKPNAIAKDTLERLFRDQLQPKAYACYQRALVASPRLSGTVLFELRMGRGEVTQVGITGTTDQKFEDCLRDAAFALTIPFPDLAINADDQTLAHYPLTFQVSEAKPVIVLGDADSSSPLDIDSIKGGVPNAKTPLGDLRPSKNP
ncbi:MAG: VWA domain-containing protein, partial [Myxococcales bacterium]|nr:VWA domain-containing protein [Myxococcales bacterium]